MKKLAKLSGVLAIALMIALPMSARADEVKTSTLDCKLTGIFQAWYRIYQQYNSAADENEINNSFDMKRALGAGLLLDE